MRSMGAFGVVGALLLVEVPMVSVCGKRLGTNGINSLFIALCGWGWEEGDVLAGPMVW